jgi:glyoxylase-like metal-dependent hydrolase (beta-lactamase superfamily II)
MRKGFAAAGVIALALGCAQETPEQQVVNDAAAALGGRERVDAVRTIAIEGGGTLYNLGQDLRPDARGQTFSVTGLTRRMDLANARARTELTRTPNFAYFQGQAAQRQVQGIDGEVGYNIGATGNATRIAAPAARDRRADFYHYPLTIVRAALTPGTTLANARTQGDHRLVDVTTDNGLVFVLAVDSVGLPSRVESKSYHANLGDVTLSTQFADYVDVSGIKLPTRITTRVDDFTTGEIRMTSHTLDGDVGDLAAPPAAASAAPSSGPPPAVVPELVAPGIWLLAGQSHHSALIEMSDHLILVDAPQNEARTLAVITKARELQPAKPLTKVITTHHHFDHTAGIRAAIAEGLTVVTHSGNREFFETVAERPHSIVTDALAKNPTPVRIETVDDELTLKDAARTVALYHMAGNPHSDTMLMVHLPGDGILVQVDAFSPNAAVNPYAANLLDNITKRKLRVDRIVPLHGAIAPFADLVKLQARQTS